MKINDSKWLCLSVDLSFDFLISGLEKWLFMFIFIQTPTWSHFNVRSHAQIKTHAWLSQKMLNLIHISLLGHLRRQAMNSALQANIAWVGASLTLGPASRTKHSIPSTQGTLKWIAHHCIRLKAETGSLEEAAIYKWSFKVCTVWYLILSNLCMWHTIFRGYWARPLPEK